MKHKNFKCKIIKAMLKINPDNYWVSFDKILDLLYVHRDYDVMPRICDELVSDGILISDTVLHYQYNDYAPSYSVNIKMYKIRKEYIEKFRNVVGE